MQSDNKRKQPETLEAALDHLERVRRHRDRMVLENNKLLVENARLNKLLTEPSYSPTTSPTPPAMDTHVVSDLQARVDFLSAANKVQKSELETIQKAVDAKDKEIVLHRSQNVGLVTLMHLKDRQIAHVQGTVNALSVANSSLQKEVGVARAQLDVLQKLFPR
jgi:regulator of replication initiation timing